jgi:TRAP-type C4-dicarboxylate transport system permease small subunit
LPAIGSIAALGMCGILLCIGSLAGFQSSSAGDLAALSTPGGLAGLGILLTGMLALLGLEMAHVMRQLQRRAGRVTRTDGDGRPLSANSRTSHDIV